MVCGAAWIASKIHDAELGIEHDEVFRKAIRAQQSPTLAGSGCVSIQKIGKSSNTAIGDHCSRGAVAAQRCGTRQGGTDHAIAKVDSSQHLVKQWRVLAGARLVERLKNPVVKDVFIVEIHRSKELGPLRSHVSHFERGISKKLALDLNVEVLNVRSDLIIRLQRLSAVGGWKRKERLV